MLWVHFFKTQKNVLPDSENKRRNYMTEKMRMAEQALEQGKGILRLAPTWVPRSFCRPGKRIKLHPDDYFILGQRGGIDERWFSSTTWAENG